MSPSEVSSLAIVAYLALFAAVGILFLFVNLLLGRFLRVSNPHKEKLEVYECGEPTIGSSFVQFDLRFYVVALLFIIFDVEVAFFFPWATAFGKAMHLADERLVVVEPQSLELTREARLLYRELGVIDPVSPDEIPASLSGRLASGADSGQIIKAGARQLAWLTILDIAIFFAVLMVGFAYVWKRGDLDWVRAVAREAPRRTAGAATGRDLVEDPLCSV
jgi:NADH-quinone oxidoreductase subunit A